MSRCVISRGGRSSSDVTSSRCTARKKRRPRAWSYAQANAPYDSPAIETLSRFLSEFPGGDHLAQQLRRLEARAERRRQHLGDAKPHVEPDEVGQPQRSHRMVVAELHGPVDVLGAGDAFLEHADGLQSDGDTEPRRGEAGRI